MKSSTKCANLHAVGDLRYESISLPECAEDEVLLAVKSCGICGSDVGRVFKKGTYHFPTVIGHEFSGEVIFDPKGELTGKGVVVFPLLPCFVCESCKNQNYATCSNYDYYGSRRDGGMSEFLVVKRWNLLLLPENISFDVGAMCEPISVARHATLKLNVKEGENLLISGAGPIGLVAAQWAKSFGVQNVFFFDIDARKVEFAKSMGFLEYTDGTQVDCVIEGTGNENALARCLSALKPFGRIVLMGNPSGDVHLSQKTYWQILRKELTLLGTWNSSYAEHQNDWEESLKALSEHKLNVEPLITHRFPLSECNEAFAMMTDGKTFYNKVMLVMNREEE